MRDPWVVENKSELISQLTSMTEYELLHVLYEAFERRRENEAEFNASILCDRKFALVKASTYGHSEGDRNLKEARYRVFDFKKSRNDKKKKSKFDLKLVALHDTDFSDGWAPDLAALVQCGVCAQCDEEFSSYAKNAVCPVCTTKTTGS